MNNKPLIFFEFFLKSDAAEQIRKGATKGFV